MGNVLPESLRRILDCPPPSLLFEGPNQTELKTSALLFAQTLLNAEKESPPDLRLLQLEGKGGYHTIQSIKQMIEEAQIPPYEASHKVFIICEAERMLPTSANALLKILEEPPPQVVILLLISHREALLPTVVSRCLSIAFKEQTRPKDRSLAETMFEIGQRLLRKDFPMHQEMLDVEDPQEALLYLFYFYRDLQLIQLKGDVATLFFQEKAKIFASIEQTAPPLSLIEEQIKTALLATALRIPLKHALVVFL